MSAFMDQIVHEIDLDLPILEKPVEVINNKKEEVQNPYLTNKEENGHESEDEDVKVVFSPRTKRNT